MLETLQDCTQEATRTPQDQDSIIVYSATIQITFGQKTSGGQQKEYLVLVLNVLVLEFCDPLSRRRETTQ